MALKALLQNRLQALLTLSGMSVGVAMVVIVSGLGRGAQLRIESQIEGAGPTQIAIRAGNLRPAAIVTTGEQDTSGGEMAEGAVGTDELGNVLIEGANAAVDDARRKARAPKQTKYRTPIRPLAVGEMELLANRIGDVRAVSGSVSGNITLASDSGIPARIARAYGFEGAWPEMAGWRVVEGRFVSDEEHADGAPVAVVSSPVAAKLWPQGSALGQSIRIDGQTVRVVGVIADGTAPGTTIVVPTLYLPLQVAQGLLKRPSYDEINVRTTSVGVTTQVSKDIKAAMRELRGLAVDELDDFRVETQSVSAMPSMGMDPRLARAVHSNVIEFEQESWEEMAKSLRQAGRTFTLLLAAAAAVSLLVGGIGVMNIMLVSVAARTREIGLRMALGARMGDVMVQFLVEAVTLAAIGGLIGLLLGGIGLFVADHGLHWATAVSPTMLVMAVAMAAITGVIFGYGPARRAAGLDPVVALKSE